MHERLPLLLTEGIFTHRVDNKKRRGERKSQKTFFSPTNWNPSDKLGRLFAQQLYNFSLVVGSLHHSLSHHRKKIYLIMLPCKLIIEKRKKSIFLSNSSQNRKIDRMAREPQVYHLNESLILRARENFIFLVCTHKTRGAKEAIVIFFVWACAIWVRAIWHFLHSFARHQPTCFDGIRGEIVAICTHFYHNWDGMSVTRNVWCKVHSRVHVRHFILPKMQRPPNTLGEKKDFTKQSHRARSYSLVILSHTDAQSGCAKAARRVGEFELSKSSVRFYVKCT